ncbi:MAG: hypothetical protein ACE5GH_02325, partial [Fidelibacterota bacterium]
MSHRRSMVLICSMIIIGWRLMADVPPPRLHKPDIPYFLQSLRFETTQMRIFPTQVSGMVINLYSDLHWNPAFVLNQREKSVYLDFNSEVEQPSFIIPILTPYSNYGEYSASKLILPRWYPTTSVNSVDTTPIYDVAALLAVSRRISLGFINRSIFDYGPFRSAMGWMGSLLEASFVPVSIPSNLEPQRLEVGNNQQTVLGTQSEMLVGYRLSKRIDLGLRLGHAVFDRDGALYDSKWATYPHSSFADL